MRKTTHAMATVKFGSGAQHEIVVTTFYGADDENGERETISIGETEWQAAAGKTIPEKLESILDWGGHWTEHDREWCHVSFET